MTVYWSSIIIPAGEVASFLTDHNFQPGKFHVIPMGFSGSHVQIVYVREEK